MAVVSMQEIAEHLNLASVDPHFGDLVRFSDAATLVVERHLGTVIDRRSFVEDVTLSRSPRALLSRRPIVSVTSVGTTDGVVSWPVDGLVVDSMLGMVSTRGAAFSGTVRFTYVAGVDDAPANVRLAALFIIGHLFESQRSVGAGPSAPGIGGDDGSLAPSVFGYAIPNRALELLGPSAPVIA